MNRPPPRGTLRVALLASPEIPVPPRHYGGVERVVHLLACELSARGHDVHLFAHGGSRSPVSLHALKSGRGSSRVATLRNVWRVWRRSQLVGGFDVMHSFGRLAYVVPAVRLSDRAIAIQSYQRHVTRRAVRLGRVLLDGRLTFTACSRACAATAGPEGAGWTVIPNGTSAEAFPFAPRVAADAPLVFLGRLERIKGVHVAIDVARRAGRSLIIAGTVVTDRAGTEYFRREIAPQCDGTRVRYVGPVTDEQKRDLLGRAAALMFPIAWEEPFGIVMVEALACGTPVIALRRGAVPEVVDHGRTGFHGDTPDDLVRAVKHLHHLDRASCRDVFERRFSARAVAEQYEALYYSRIRRRGS